MVSHIKSIIIDYAADSATDMKHDSTTIPIGKILSTSATFNHGGVDPIKPTVVSYASDFVPRQEIPASTYSSFTQARHDDCMDLFDGYESSVIRCEALDETRINVRWEASWIPAGSTWLYKLADGAGWTVTRKSPDPAMVAKFSWKNVFGMFQRAFATGDIILPISSVEGNTLISISEMLDDDTSDDVSKYIFSVTESLDLVWEADKNRLQNRRVAQELASWIDVSRRPPKELLGGGGTMTMLVDTTMEEWWAGIVRERILTGVPGAGPLDVDPNEDDTEGDIALVVFGVICLGALALSFEYFIVPEIVGGSGKIPDRCDDGPILEFGSGYLSECFDSFGGSMYK